MAIRTPMDSFTNDHLSCLAVVQDSSVHFWFLPQGKSSFVNSLPTSSNQEFSASNLSTYKPQPISSNPIQSIQWNPRSFKLAVIDKSGGSVYLQQLLFGKNHDYAKTTSDILTLSVQSENFTATCIGFPRSSGRYLAVGINTGLINVYNCGNKQITLRCQLRCTNLHPFNILPNELQPKCISWALNDRIIAAGYNNGSIVLFLAASDKISTNGGCKNFVLPFPCQYSKVRGCDVSLPECCMLKTSKFNSNLLCCGYSNGSIILWNIQWPVIGDTNNYILNYWDVKSFGTSMNKISILKESYKYCISIAFSSTNDQLLYSAGLPDLNLRVWDILSTSGQQKQQQQQQKPVKCLSPVDEQHGYLSIDVASRTHFLATGLVNGEVWLYNVQNMSTPIHCVSIGSGNNSIRLLSFSSALRPDLNDVNFNTTTYNNNNTSKEAVLCNLSTSTSQITNENSYSTSMNSTHLTCNNGQIRQALGELTNRMATSTTTETTGKTEQSKSQTRWAVMLHEFDQPESESLTSIISSNRSLLDQSLLISSGTSEAVTVDSINQKSLASSSSLKSLTSHPYDSILKDNKSFPPIPIDTSSRHSNTVDTEKLEDTAHTTAHSPHIPIEALSKCIDSRLSSVMSELNWSHSELLYKFAQLECKLDQMNELLVQMKLENDMMRLALIT
ncbi:unnamed protein product, partial [Trichobilharzia regenti]